MKVIVLGGGLIGLTTAYVLSSRGHEVSVIERNDGVGQETSFSNGGQLSYCHAEPWATPGTPAKLCKWLFREDSPLIIRPRADLKMLTWGMQFLTQCTTAASRKNCIDMLRLGLYSKERLKEIREKTNIQFDFQDKGVLHVFSREAEFHAARKQFDFQRHYGCDEKLLGKDEVLELEPSLAHTERDILGGMHVYLDETGDSYLYCLELKRYLEDKVGVEFLLNTDIQDLRIKDGAVEAVLTDKGEYTADKYVVALSAYSPLLTRKHQLSLPIYPMKGYSITVPVQDDAPKASITDTSYKIVYTRLGKRIRVSGTAELAGYNTNVMESRINPIVKQARRLFPHIDWESERSEWSCIRPSTPDGPPRIGKTKYSNLLLNTGHGTLGWTQAAGSGYILADILEGKEPEVSSNGPMVQL